MEVSKEGDKQDLICALKSHSGAKNAWRGKKQKNTQALIAEVMRASSRIKAQNKKVFEMEPVRLSG